MKVTGRNGRVYEMPLEELRAKLTARTGRGQWIPRRQWSVNHWRFYRSPNGELIIAMGGDTFAVMVAVGKLTVTWDAD